MRNYSIFILFLLSFVYTSVVFWEPEVPVPGGDITIYYNTSEGSLPEQMNPAYIHLGHSGWLEVQDYEMVSVQIDNDGIWWKFLYQIPEEATTIDFVGVFAEKERKIHCDIVFLSVLFPILTVWSLWRDHRNHIFHPLEISWSNLRCLSML